MCKCMCVYIIFQKKLINVIYISIHINSMWKKLVKKNKKYYMWI
jgi:hypothetical protein